MLYCKQDKFDREHLCEFFDVRGSFLMLRIVCYKFHIEMAARQCVCGYGREDYIFEQSVVDNNCRRRDVHQCGF